MKARLLILSAISAGVLALGAMPAEAATTHPILLGIDTQSTDFNYDLTAAATETNSFGGYSVDASTKTVVALIADGASEGDISRVKSAPLPEGFTLKFQPVKRSWTDLEALQASLPTALPSALRPLLSEVSIQPTKNNLDVGLTLVPPGAQTAVDQLFGEGLLHLVQKEKATVNATGQTRDNETTGPFHAGARIKTYHVYTDNQRSFDICTAGFVIIIGGTSYGTTAGHCGTGGGKSRVDAPTNDYIGEVVHRTFNDGAWDTEYYSSASLSTAMWIGGTSSSTGKQVKGTYTPASTTTVCGSGATSGQQCTSEMANGGVCATLSDPRTGSEYVCGLGTVNNDNSRVCQPGDSGGPVSYTNPSGLYYAVGSIVGASSSTCYYHTIAKVLSHWGATLATG